MPANARSLQLTDTYRQRKVAIVDRVQREAREAWPTIDTLDGTKWAEVMAQKLTRAQTEGIRLTAGYLTAYTASETGQRSRTAPISTRPYAGLSRDGRPLREALRSPLIGTLTALKDNPPDKALSIGLARALRMVGFEASQAPRDALLDTIESDDRFSGWNRAVAGTCAACMALSSTSGPRFEVHPGCQCEPEPFVAKPEWFWKTDEERFSIQVPDEVEAAAPTDAAFNEAARRYSGNLYRKLNEKLTSGEALTADEQVVFDTLQAAMKELPTGPTVWRGVNPRLEMRVFDDAVEKTADWAEETFKPGSVVGTRGLQSTSFYTEPALNAAVGTNQPGVIFEIVANRGTYLGKATQFDDEAELLLPHGARFRVREVIRRVSIGQGIDADPVERTVILLEQI